MLNELTINANGRVYIADTSNVNGGKPCYVGDVYYQYDCWLFDARFAHFICDSHDLLLISNTLKDLDKIGRDALALA